MAWRRVTQSRAGAAAIGLAAGTLLAGTLPPWGWWPLAMVAGAGLMTAWAEAPFRRRLLMATGFGLGFHVIGMWWMTEFSVPGYGATVVVETAILALPLLAVPASGLGRLAAFPAALVVAQAVQGHWPFGGVPVNGIALGQVGGPLAPAARLGGHLVLVALVGLAGVALAGLGQKWVGRPAAPDRRSGFAGAAAALAVVVVALGGAVAPRGSVTGVLPRGGGAGRRRTRPARHQRRSRRGVRRSRPGQ